jgi:hypothetical protein
MIGPLISTVKDVFLGSTQKRVWATFWANFSQTHPVTLVVAIENDAASVKRVAQSRVARWLIFKPVFWYILEGL